jgi:hypothetical protein
VDERTLAAVEKADTDELIRIIDGHCTARAWDRLHALRLHCQAAVERGKQLWAVDEHIRYRLALEAPAEHAGPVVTEGRARWTLGPLAEVAASSHSWAELEPHLAPGPERAMVAHERIVRGEDLRGADFDRQTLELPAALEAWEPGYPAAVYHADRAEFPTPPSPTFAWVETPGAAPSTAEPESIEALAALTAVWVDQSSGRSEVREVHGTALEAIGALGIHRVGVARVEPSSATAWMAWAAASGGAYGRRSGGATGRFAAWWAVAALAGVEWPPEPGELGEAVAELAWHLWTDGSPEGWRLQLAVEDPGHGLAWALSAIDLPPG